MDNELERRMSVGLAIVSTIRSLRQQFELPNKIHLNGKSLCFLKQ